MNALAGTRPRARGGWQWGVEPASATPRARDLWRFVGFDEVYGQPMRWTDIDAPEVFPGEGAVGSIDAWREAQRYTDSYLVAARGVWSGFPDPLSFSLWRMKSDETDWRFLGHFDDWPAGWTTEAAL